MRGAVASKRLQEQGFIAQALAGLAYGRMQGQPKPISSGLQGLQGG